MSTTPFSSTVSSAVTLRGTDVLIDLRLSYSELKATLLCLLAPAPPVSALHSSAMSSSSVDPGNTTWLLTSTALVLTMSPALAMFEAGLLRSKSTLSIFTQIYSGIIVLGVLWFVVGYSLTFGESAQVIGNPLQHALFIDVSYSEPSIHAPDIPAAAFAIFQMMFAVITPLLITGSYAERMPFKVFLVFSVAFSVLVYYPTAHSVWGQGFLMRWGVLDFAGGICVHTTAGVSSLVVAVMIGKRKDFAYYVGEFPPSNLPLAGIGCGLLWLGWTGFNGGSALNGGSVAVSACVSTQIGAVSSGFVWLVLSMWRGKPACSALMNGLLAGLAGITPASGYINSPASLLLGAILGFCSYWAVQLQKHKLGVDDALDVSAVHGLTGMIGSIYIGFFSSVDVNADGANGLVYGGGVRLLLCQVAAVALAAVWSAVVTFVLLLICQYTFAGGIRVSEDEEEVGLDWAHHGEIAYHKLHVLVEWEKRQAKYAQFALTDRELHMEEQEREREEQHVRQVERDRRMGGGEGGLTHDSDGSLTPDDRSEEKDGSPRVGINSSPYIPPAYSHQAPSSTPSTPTSAAVPERSRSAAERSRGKRSAPNGRGASPHIVSSTGRSSPNSFVPLPANDHYRMIPSQL